MKKNWDYKNGSFKKYFTKYIISKKVRKLADEKKIVLIFDECTTGFRRVFGGLHLLINVIPDIAIFGKALGNGYAITAVLGKDFQ